MLERFENNLLLLGRDADAGIFHLEADDALGAIQRLVLRRPPFRRLRNLQRNDALVRKFESVRQQILENLLQPFRIGVHRSWQSILHLDLEVELLALGHVAERAIDVIMQIAEGDIADIDDDRAGFDLRQIENVVDEREQIVAGRVDRLGKLNLSAREVALRYSFDN